MRGSVMVMFAGVVVACGPVSQTPSGSVVGDRSQVGGLTTVEAPALTLSERAAADSLTTGDLFLAAHAAARAAHRAEPLTWSNALAAYAQQWADQMAASGCKLGHSGGPYGENVAAGIPGTLHPETVVGMWYEEIANYNFKSIGLSPKTGNFTQVVWRATKQLGCGVSVCNSNEVRVCEYDPPGNAPDQYAVQPRGAGLLRASSQQQPHAAWSARAPSRCCSRRHDHEHGDRA
jgi:uncharacterized protein YkwD